MAERRVVRWQCPFGQIPREPAATLDEPRKEGGVRDRVIAEDQHPELPRTIDRGVAKAGPEMVDPRPGGAAQLARDESAVESPRGNAQPRIEPADQRNWCDQASALVEQLRDEQRADLGTRNPFLALQQPGESPRVLEPKEARNPLDGLGWVRRRDSQAQEPPDAGFTGRGRDVGLVKSGRNHDRVDSFTGLPTVLE